MPISATEIGSIMLLEFKGQIGFLADHRPIRLSESSRKYLAVPAPEPFEQPHFQKTMMTSLMRVAQHGMPSSQRQTTDQSSLVVWTVAVGLAIIGSPRLSGHNVHGGPR
jgi:hypothetical protein